MGSFVAIVGVSTVVVGMIAEVVLTPKEDRRDSDHRATAAVDLIGEIVKTDTGSTAFRRGVRRYPGQWATG